jgi:hypothetical protein
MRRPRLTYSNVTSTLALFIALGGTGAYAANTIGSSDIIDESLLSQDIKNGEVKNKDIGGNQITSALIYPDTVTGADVKESTLNLGDFFAAGSGVGGCQADDHQVNTCATANVTLARPGRLLLNATGEWHTFALDDTAGVGADSDDPTLVRGLCQLYVDGNAVGIAQTVGERRDNAAAASVHPFGGTMALTGLSGVVAAGAHVVSTGCTEQDGDLDWGAINLTAARIDDDGTTGKAATAARPRDSVDPGKEPLTSAR